MNMKRLKEGGQERERKREKDKKKRTKTILFFGILKKMLLSVIVVPGMLSKKPSPSE